MSSTQQKKWSPPEGWEADSSDTQTFGEGPDDTPAFTGTRTYPDGTVREVIAHSEAEFDALANATDDAKRLQDRNKRSELLEQARVLKAQVKDLEQQAKQYDWA